MRHLIFGTCAWCDVEEEAIDIAEDPRDATCVDCLRRAAAYGAAAAMRYAAVEAGGTRDPELVRERDEAIRRIDTISAGLEEMGTFFCVDCEGVYHIRTRALRVNTSSWCMHCAPEGT